jgi:hypothetical protein
VVTTWPSRAHHKQWCNRQALHSNSSAEVAVHQLAHGCVYDSDPFHPRVTASRQSQTPLVFRGCHFQGCTVSGTAQDMSIRQVTRTVTVQSEDNATVAVVPLIT